MTHKQNIFSEYLLKRIGFQNPETITNYLKKLERVHGRYFKEWKEVTYKNGYKSGHHYWRYSASPCIDVLLDEINLKEKPYLIKDKEISNTPIASATDLANFNFCPASYSISKSFEIEYPTNEDKRVTGLELHESLRLLNRKIPNEWDKDSIEDYSISNNPSLKKIKNCKLIFSGHSDQNIYFSNDEKNYLGQPDYIFEDTNRDQFVVEEKFKYLNSYYQEDDSEQKSYHDKVKRTFHSNHIVQLLSYLHYIKDFKLKYGVLIYWFYDFYGNEQPYIHHVSIKVIKSDYPLAPLNSTHEGLINFVKNSEMEFKEGLNPFKCASCVVNKYCSHKTNEHSILKFPYDKSILKLERAEFPEELKKNPVNRR